MSSTEQKPYYTLYPLLFLCLLDLVLSQDFMVSQRKKERGYKKYRIPGMDKDGKKKPCGELEFSCANGNCIPISGYCNFDKQCDDNSDELDCVWPPCNKTTEFTCANGECINITLYNNFVYDCTDKSDEDKKKCNGFQCNDGQCIPQHLKCDGEIDCAGIYKEDERDCRQGPNPAYAQELWNDGIGFCKNNHWYRRNFECQYTTKLGYMETCRDATHLEGCAGYPCPPSMHKCPESYCIPYETRCDDVKDCPHGEDEFDCDREDNGHKTDLIE